MHSSYRYEGSVFEKFDKFYAGFCEKFGPPKGNKNKSQTLPKSVAIEPRIAQAALQKVEQAEQSFGELLDEMMQNFNSYIRPDDDLHRCMLNRCGGVIT